MLVAEILDPLDDYVQININLAQLKLQQEIVGRQYIAMTDEIIQYEEKLREYDKKYKQADPKLSRKSKRSKK